MPDTENLTIDDLLTTARGARASGLDPAIVKVMDVGDSEFRLGDEVEYLHFESHSALVSHNGGQPPLGVAVDWHIPAHRDFSFA